MSRSRCVVWGLRLLVTCGAGAVALVTWSWYLAPAATAAPICSTTGNSDGTLTLTITLDGGHVTFGDQSGQLVVSPAGSGCGGTLGLENGDIASVSLDDGSSDTGGDSVSLDQQTPYDTWPCASGISVQDNLSQPWTLIVDGGPTEDVTAGAAGVNLTPGACDNNLLMTDGALSLQLNAGGRDVTLSAAGGDGTGAPSTLPVVMNAIGGDDHFVAGAGTDTFTDTDPHSVGGDSVDFSAVSTSSQFPLTVNTSSTLVAGVAAGTAQTATATYRFTSTQSNFTSFTGASSGHTVFVAGNGGGVSFTGQSSGNSADFSPVSVGVSVNLSSSPVSVSVPDGTVTVDGVDAVTGSSAGGNEFAGGAGPSTYSFSASGNANTFRGGSGHVVFTASGNGNVFDVGTGNATLNATGSGNTVSFAGLAGPVTVNRSGQQVQSIATNTATVTVADTSVVYDFSSFGTTPATFVGASTGGNTFYAGSSADTFTGGGTSGNVLDFSAAVGVSTLRVCADLPLTGGGGCSTGDQAIANQTVEPFQHIQQVNGLAAGNTSFVTADTKDLTFSATGTNNSADFSADPNSVSIDLNAGTATDGTGTDHLSGITAATGSAAGANTFVAGTTSETFTDPHSVGGDSVDFSAVSTSSQFPLTVNTSSTLVAGVAAGTAQTATATYRFTSTQSNFTSFTGASSGHTVFVAGNGGGVSFTGQSSGNSADFSPVAAPLTADMATGDVSVGAITPDVLGGTFLTGDSGPNTVVGSHTAANTFDGALTGTAFHSSSASNTLSYALATQPVTVNLVNDRVSAASGAPDTFTFAAGSLTVDGAPYAGGTFVIGSAPVALRGAGGQDALDLSQLPVVSGVDVDLGAGSISGSGIGGVTFTPGTPGQAVGSCTSTVDLCVTSVTGTTGTDTFTPASTALNTSAPLQLTGNGGADILNLSHLTSAATVCMPIAGPSPLGASAPCTSAGFVINGAQPQVGPPAAAPISFTGIGAVSGTSVGSDYIYAGTGPETINDTGQGTLDFSNLPGVTSASQGVAVATNLAGGIPQATVTTPASMGDNASITGITTFIGTRGNDTFTQAGAGDFTFAAAGGANELDLSAAAAGTTVRTQRAGTLAPSNAPCDPRIVGNKDGTAELPSSVNDVFSCIATLIQPPKPKHH